MILSSCTNCHSLIRYQSSNVNPWVDETGGVRCPKSDPDAPVSQHMPPTRYLILANVIDEMEKADRQYGQATPIEYMIGITKAFQTRLHDMANPGRHHDTE